MSLSEYKSECYRGEIQSKKSQSRCLLDLALLHNTEIPVISDFSRQRPLEFQMTQRVDVLSVVFGTEPNDNAFQLRIVMAVFRCRVLQFTERHVVIVSVDHNLMRGIVVLQAHLLPVNVMQSYLGWAGIWIDCALRATRGYQFVQTVFDFVTKIISHDAL